MFNIPPKIHNELNYEGIELDISNIDLNPIYQSDNPNFFIDCLIKSLQTALNKNTVITNLPRRKRLIKPWITQGLLRCMRHRAM